MYHVLLPLLLMGSPAAFASNPPRDEPVWGGCSLSAWVRELPVPGEFDQDREQYATNVAVRAVRRVGTNALPFLIGWVQKPEKVSRMDATLGLVFLGDAAKPAFPQLIGLLNNEELTDDASIVLRRLGADGVQALTNGFMSTNSPVRAATVLSFCSQPINDPKQSNDVEVIRFQQQRAFAIPGIVALLRDPKYEVGAAAAFALGDFNEEANVVAPALTTVLNDTNTDARIRKVALKSLRRLGIRPKEDDNAERK